MILIYILAGLLAFLIVSDLIAGLRIRLHADLERDGSRFSLTFLYPLLKAEAKIDDDVTRLTVYLLKLKIFDGKVLGKRKFKIKRLYKALKVSNLELSTSYGFRDPSVTGWISGSAGILSTCVNIRRLDLMPDFVAEENYIRMDASLNIKVGHTIVDYFKNNA